MSTKKLENKKRLLTKRCFRIRHKVSGTADRPRLTLKLSNKHLYAQAIDDVAGKTLVAFCSTSKNAPKVLPNIEGATVAGEAFGKELLAKKIEKVVFDRNGRRYHGTVKAFADAVRKAGVQF